MRHLGGPGGKALVLESKIVKNGVPGRHYIC